MVPDSPGVALGAEATALRDLIVEVVRTRHSLSADAHVVSESRYAMGFGSQWRDLLDDTRDVLQEHGFRFVKLSPGGHSIPVVNDALIYVWRVPNNPNAVSEFALSPTRKNGFATPPPEPVLWEPSLSSEPVPTDDTAGGSEIGPVLLAAGDNMPLVLVMVQSTPRALQSIEWAIAVLDNEGKVELRGQESLWEPEPATNDATARVESFDSGAPVEAKVEPREREGSRPDA